MGNPFFLPDVPVYSSTRRRQVSKGRFEPVLMLIFCSVRAVLSSAAILLTLSDAFSAGGIPATVIAELE